MNRTALSFLVALATALFLAAGCGAGGIDEASCNSCPTWSMVNSDGCEAIATELNCESFEVVAVTDDRCGSDPQVEHLVCNLTRCDDPEDDPSQPSTLCEPFAQP